MGRFRCTNGACPHRWHRTVERAAHCATTTVATAATAAAQATTAPTPDIRAALNPEAAAALTDVAAAIDAAGGRAVLVGGAVRDMLLGVDPKDLDIEVSGLEPDELRQVLVEHTGTAELVGESFGVYKTRHMGHDFDVTIPRTETSTGRGHTDFDVSVDPTLDFDDAARRRDFTIGAMGWDPLTGELLDPYDGHRDLEDGVIRHVDADSFREDPLRVYRAARFAARFGFTVDPDTARLCRDMRPDADELPPERVWGELASTLQTARRPGEFLRVLRDVGWHDTIPELAACASTPQNPTHHPEGDVFNHTAHALDHFGSVVAPRLEPDERLVVGAAVLCHDLGKPSATTTTSDGRIIAHGHEDAGVEPVRALLAGRFAQSRLAGRVEPLVREHLRPLQLANIDPSDRAVRRLAETVPIRLAVAVAECDAAGRPPIDASDTIDRLHRLQERAETLGIADRPAVSHVSGRMLIDRGMKPGPEFKPILARLREMELDGLIDGPVSAAAAVDQMLA